MNLHQRISNEDASKGAKRVPETANIQRTQKTRDFSDHLEAYLAKRDGVDKLLKIARYSAKIVLVSSVVSSESQFGKRLKDFEGSVGVSRKAFRLGKFIQDYNALKKISLGSRDGFLEIIAYGGEGIYYFVEQLTWLIKAGLIDKRYANRLNKLSAWTEFLGYLGSICLKSLQIRDLKEEENRLKSKEEKSLEVSDRLKVLREKQALKLVSIIQDFADSLMALADMRDSKGMLSNPLLLAFAGLLSGLISAQKNWSSC
eukprot:TRINITY_DN1711_c0_g1_i1.p1 TRINITY_DN1711_c0_g1~~TRINITY_DN1711_c0_g1_i1.p1  ORF type:complete len:258 (+),score=53.68 TRINITY_DN1711_c0_g1_i1:164-937(+)